MQIYLVNKLKFKIFLNKGMSMNASIDDSPHKQKQNTWEKDI